MIKLTAVLALTCMAAWAQSPMYAPATVSMANAGTTGTTTAKLVKCTGAPCTAVIATTSDTSGVLGVAVSGAGTSGNVLFAPTHGPGIVPLAMDGATTAGDLVIPSTTAGGSGHDSGVAANGTCPSSQVIGVVLSTNGGSGTYQVSLGGTCVSGGSTPRYGQLISGDGTVTGIPITDSVDWDEMMVNSTTTGSVGKWGWNLTGCAGSIAPPTVANTALPNHPGIYQPGTGTSANSSCAFSIGTNGNGFRFFPDLSATANWEIGAIIQPVTSVDSNTIIRVGIGDPNNTIDLSAGSYMVELASGNAVPGDFYLKSCNATPTCNSIDTGIAPTIGHWYRIRVFCSVSGTIGAQISTDGGAYSSAVTVTANNTSKTSPIVYIKTLTTANRDMFFDYFGYRISGLAR